MVVALLRRDPGAAGRPRACPVTVSVAVTLRFPNKVRVPLPRSDLDVPLDVDTDTLLDSNTLADTLHLVTVSNWLRVVLGVGGSEFIQPAVTLVDPGRMATP